MSAKSKPNSPRTTTATFTLGANAARKVSRVQKWEARSAEKKLVLTGRG